MSQTALARISTPKLARFSELLRRVRGTLVLAQSQIQKIKVRAYWETGRWIHIHVLHHRERAGYDQEVILRLSRELDTSRENLYRALRLYRTYPIVTTLRQLTWSHFLEFMKIADAGKRLELESQAVREDWPVARLRSKVQQLNAKAAISRSGKSTGGKRKTPELLEPKKGRTGIYQIVPDGEGLALDLGFRNYIALDSARARKWKANDRVSFDSEEIRPAKGTSAADLFTYEAEVLHVPDADTIWMKIWLKRPQWIKEKLRLRGIDAPEVHTPEGRTAKRFVERQLQKASRILITTTKPDKWDRYLSDVFLEMPGGREIFLNNLLLLKGYARLYDKVSFEDWEE